MAKTETNTVITKDEIKYPKPDPEIYIKRN